MKKIILLPFLVLFFTISGFAQKSGKSGNLNWVLDKTGVLVISGSCDMQDYYFPDFAPWSSYNDIIHNIIIQEGVTSIGNYAFYNLVKLSSIQIPQSVKRIGEVAFGNCTGLVSIDLPKSITHIENSAFHSCRSLTSIVLPTSLNTIDWSTFEGCTKLTSVTIPESVTEIKGTAFKGCKSLSHISIPASVADIKGDAFSNCERLTNFQVDKNNPYLSATNGVIYNKKQTALICYPAGKTEKNFSIPNGVTVVEYYAFGTCTHLTSVTIPQTVTRIDDWAFSECKNITSMQVNSNPPTLGKSVFSGVRKENCIVNIPKNINRTLYANDNTWKQFKLVSK